jgi:hypothetical protein
MKKAFTLLTVAIVVILSGCSVSINDKLEKGTYKEDIAALVKKQLLNEEEEDVLISYIISNETDSLILSKSYSELLAVAKEQKRMETELAEKKKKLNESLTVQVIRKYNQNLLDEGYWKNFLLLDITVQNNTEKQLSGFKIDINFKNADGVSIYSAWWPVSNNIKPNSKITMVLSTGEYKNTNPDQLKLQMADIEKLKIDYDVLELMYDDGTSLTAY